MNNGSSNDWVLAVQGLTKIFAGQRPLYNGVNLVVREGQILVIVGESGIGKSVFLSLLVGLQEPTAGSIWYRMNSGEGAPPVELPIHQLAEEDMEQIRKEVGIVFQESSLFDWMTVYENISLPLLHHPEVIGAWIDEFRKHPGRLCEHLAAAKGYMSPRLEALFHVCGRDPKLVAAGIEEALSVSREALSNELIDAAVKGRMAEVRLDIQADRNKLPSECSGGMKTRIGIARTLALRPRVLLYDEPTAGLDPMMAKGVANAILDLQRRGIVRTSVVVTHDKELYWTLRDGTETRLIYLHRGRFLDDTGQPVNDFLAGSQPAPAAAPAVGVADRREPMKFISEFTVRDWSEVKR